MKNIASVFLSLMFANISFSQVVEVVRKSNINLPAQKVFAFIEQTTDTSKTKFVATILARDKNFKNSILEQLFLDIREQANKLGANCFKLESFTRGGDRNEVILILNCYVASDSLIDQNFSNHEKNAVFIFGGEKENKATYSFKVNDVHKEIPSGTYFKYVIKEGEVVKFNKGGILGETLWIKWKKDRQPEFYTLSSLGLGVGLYTDTIAISTGKLNRINNVGFGLLLTKILNKSD